MKRILRATTVSVSDIRVVEPFQKQVNVVKPPTLRVLPGLKVRRLRNLWSYHALPVTLYQSPIRGIPLDYGSRFIGRGNGATRRERINFGPETLGLLSLKSTIAERAV